MTTSSFNNPGLTTYDHAIKWGAAACDQIARAATRSLNQSDPREVGCSRSRRWPMNASTAAETNGERGRTTKMPASRDPSTDGNTQTKRPDPSSPLTSQSEGSAMPTPESAS